MSTVSPNRKIPLVVIAGPTAVGKSDMAVRVALHLDGEVITADSMQIYKGMDICTDKPGEDDMRGIPHHMIDIVRPDEPFNVVQYRDLAKEVIRKVHRRGRLPILSGGTGLYIRGVLGDLVFPDNESDPELRRRLEAKAERKGRPYVHEQLRRIDPATANRLHPNDLRRVIRAIEVYELTGETLSQQLANVKTRGGNEYDTVMIALNRPREELYGRIEARVDDQIERGLIDEVQSLIETYDTLPMAGQSIGVKEIVPVITGEMSLEEAVSGLKQNTRRYAKRQLTWFRRDERFTWFHMDDTTPVERVEEQIIHFIRTSFARR